MKSVNEAPKEASVKEGETVYKVQTFTDKLSAAKVKSCIERKVLKKILTIDIPSES